MQRGRAKWIETDNLIEYIGKKEDFIINCELHLFENNPRDNKFLYIKQCENYKEFNFLLLDACGLLNKNLIFFNNIGIFQKQNNKWQMIKDLKDMKFDFFYPDWSPDGEYLVGVSNNDKLKVITYEDLLKE